MKIQLTNIDIKKIFAKHGFKTTNQRIVVYQTLLSSKEHPNAENIFEAISNEYPSISLGTIYKTLDLFVENGLANQVPSSDGTNRYDGNINNHNHIYISNTNEILDFVDNDLNELIKSYLETKSIKNLNVMNVSVQINGSKIYPEKDVIVK